MNGAREEYRASRKGTAIFAAMFGIMVVVPWTGFVQPRPNWVHFGLTLGSGMLVPIVMLDRWQDRMIGAGLFAPALFVPAIIVSDLMAHLIWTGDVLY